MSQHPTWLTVISLPQNPFVGVLEYGIPFISGNACNDDEWHYGEQTEVRVSVANAFALSSGTGVLNQLSSNTAESN